MRRRFERRWPEREDDHGEGTLLSGFLEVLLCGLGASAALVIIYAAFPKNGTEAFGQRDVLSSEMPSTDLKKPSGNERISHGEPLLIWIKPEVFSQIPEAIRKVRLTSSSAEFREWRSGSGNDDSAQDCFFCESFPRGGSCSVSIPGGIWRSDVSTVVSVQYGGQTQIAHFLKRLVGDGMFIEFFAEQISYQAGSRTSVAPDSDGNITVVSIDINGSNWIR
jgi:hypothetical protein